MTQLVLSLVLFWACYFIFALSKFILSEIVIIFSMRILSGFEFVFCIAIDTFFILSLTDTFLNNCHLTR